MAKGAYIGIPTDMGPPKTLGSMIVGDTVKLNENGSPVEYLVVHQGLPTDETHPQSNTMYDTSCNGTWLLRKDVYEKRIWHSAETNSYKASTIHSYLNNTFVNVFDANVRSTIKQAKIPYLNGTGNASSTGVGSGSSGLSAKVFLLSAREIGITNSFLSSGTILEEGFKLSYFTQDRYDSKRIAYYNGETSDWYLRTPLYGYDNIVLRATKDGGFTNTGGFNTWADGIRPALIMPQTCTVSDDGLITGETSDQTISTVKDVARKIKKGYIGVDSIARKIKKAYIGIGGGVTYREVEYIESSGTQYIDTLLKPNQDTRVVVDISVVGQVSDFCAVLGSRNGASSAAFCLWLNTGIIYPQYGNVAYNNKSINLVTGGRLLIDMNSNIATVNDVSVTSTKTDFSSTYSMCLLALNSAGTVDSRKVNGKLRSCQIYDNGTLVRDYAPVINPNGTPGLFDKVTKQFYANKGTGNFTAGAETGATHVSSGIARPCWGGGELSYYGVVTALSAARHDFAAASNGEYAVFAGGIGKDSYGNDQIVGTVDGYSKNLTRTTSSTPLAIAFGLAGTNVGRYALFAGGANTSQCLNSVTSYDDSLTRKDVVSLNGSRHSLAATTVGSYALFGGGNYSRNSMSTSNQIDAFTDTLTKASLTPQGLAIARFGLSATTIGDYALFGPGAQNGSNDSTGIDVYDSNLTRTSTISITDTKKFYGAASNGVYALFGGGTTGGYVDKYSSVDAIDINLTKTSITPLSIARQYVSAANLGEYIIFAGGGTNGAVVGTTAVDVYDKQLVRTVGTDLSSARNRMAATSIGDFILFAGGYYAGAKLDIVDAFALI